MKEGILEFLRETKQKLIGKYLEDNCGLVEQTEDYGDTEATVGYYYEDEDCAAAENYAEDIIKEAFDEFFKEKSVNIFGAIENAKKVLDKL